MCILNLLTINKYYKMSDEELEKEAVKWNIKQYATQNGLIIRQVIIDAIIKKNKANDSRLAIAISILALIVSILVLIFK